MEIVQNFLLSDLTGVFHLKLLLNVDSGFLLGDGENSTLHQGVQHPVLDGLVSSRRRASVDEEDRCLLCSIMGMGKPIKGESWLDSRDALDELGEGVGVGGFGCQLYSFGSRVNFLCGMVISIRIRLLNQMSRGPNSPVSPRPFAPRQPPSLPQWHPR